MQSQSININKQVYDFRSDVVSIPPYEMRQAMYTAEIGDDTFFGDPTTLMFQQRIAQYFGKQAALITPTATMGNLIGVKLWTKPGDQVIISAHSHTIDRQAGGIALIGGVQTLQITGKGVFNLQQIKSKIKKQHPWCMIPPTKLLFIENGTFGGDVWPLEDLKELKKFAAENNIKIHIDGARILNAIAHYGCNPKQVGQLFDSMIVCLNKGLCCPIGGVLVGSKQDILRARSIRKSLGGGMKQTGFIGASGIYALDNLVPEIKKDNEMAKYIAEQLSLLKKIIVKVQDIKINIINFGFKDSQNFDHDQFIKFMKENKINLKPMNQDSGLYRLCTHRTLREKQCEHLIETIKNFLSK